MINITGYSDQELSLVVFNTEFLYSIRHDDDLWEILEVVYIFTDEQREQLEIDLEEDAGDE